MKQLIQKAIANRKRLNRLGKSYHRSEQFIINLEYWIASGASILVIVENHEAALRLLMTKNFIKQFEILKEGL
jgi:hypothetical protein